MLGNSTLDQVLKDFEINFKIETSAVSNRKKAIKTKMLINSIFYKENMI